MGPELGPSASVVGPFMYVIFWVYAASRLGLHINGHGSLLNRCLREILGGALLLTGKVPGPTSIALLSGPDATLEST